MKERKKLFILSISLFAFFCVSVFAAETAVKSKQQTQSQSSSGAPTLKGKTININKASAEDIVKNVPLITLDLAKKIVQFRKDNGDFQTMEELLQIDGFTRDLLRKIKPFLLLEGIGGKHCTC
jgi:competence ComEA-like helix-hairpin-helix protein